MASDNPVGSFWYVEWVIGKQEQRYLVCYKGLLSKMQQMLDVCGRKIAVFKPFSNKL